MTFKPVLLATLACLAFSTPAAAQASPPAAAADEGSDLARMLRISPPPRLSERKIGATPAPCEIGMPRGKDEAEGETYHCGTLTVPLSWEKPEGPRIDLHYIVVRATDPDPEPDPLVYLAGGPGQSAVTSALTAHAGARRTRDIVRMDQRGTGLSQRLGVEECLVLAVQNPAAQEAIAALAAFLTAPPEGGDGSGGDAFNARTREMCAREFESQGLDLAAFTTAQSARDVLFLVQELGYPSFNLHGVSYGTRLAMTIMATIDGVADAPGLRAAVLDSTLPPSVYLLASLPRWQHDPVVQLLADCEADKACREAFPNLGGRLGGLFDALAKAPLAVDGETVTTDDLASVLKVLTHTRPAFIPRMIAELERGELRTYLGLRDRSLGAQAPEGGANLDMTDPVQAFIAKSLQFLGGDGEMGRMIEFLAGVSSALGGDDPGAALAAFLSKSYDGDRGEALRALAHDLKPEDFEASPFVQEARESRRAAARSPSATPEDEAERQVRTQRLLTVASLAYFLNVNIHCIEDYGLERYEDGLNAVHDLRYPQLADLDFLRGQATSCDGWPTSPAPREVKNPVESDVPTLVLQGAYDNRTPVYMGRRASRELSDSRLVIVPQQGHEVWIDARNCAGRIAAAFLDSPKGELDTGCLEARRPAWAMPSAE